MNNDNMKKRGRDEIDIVTLDQLNKSNEYDEPNEYDESSEYRSGDESSNEYDELKMNKRGRVEDEKIQPQLRDPKTAKIEKYIYGWNDTGRRIEINEFYPPSPLFFQWRIKKKKYLKIVIPIPYNYPDTPFVKLQAKLNSSLVGKFERIFGDLHITIEDDGNLHLDSFYVYPQYVHYKENVASLEEKIATKGIGKQMLCFALTLLNAHNLLDHIDDKVITLNASGGHCNAHNFGNYENMSKEEIIDRLKPHDKLLESIELGQYFRAPKNIKEWQELLCDIEENYKLVAYYKLYGFEVTDARRGAEISMEAPLINVLKACKMSPTLFGGYSHSFSTRKHSRHRSEFCSSQQRNANKKVGCSKKISRKSRRSTSRKRRKFRRTNTKCTRRKGT
jgi:hypothetical protein